MGRLKYIAVQCPFTFGPSVYQARAILLGMDTTFVDYWNECEYPSNPNVDGKRNILGKIETSPVPFGKIFPNPSSEDFNYEYELPDGSTANMTIYNAIGQKVANYTLTSGIQMLHVPTSSLKNGVYYVKIIVKDDEYSKKFILNR